MMRLLLVLLLAIAGLLYFLGETTPGLQTTVKLVSHFAPVQIQEAEGKLFSSFTLKNIHYIDTTEDVSIDSIDFDWNPSQLFYKMVDINQLTIRHIIYKSSDTESEFDYKTLKTALQHLVVKQFALYDLSYVLDHNSPVNIQEIRLQQKSADDFYLFGKTSFGEIEGTYAASWDMHWSINFPNLGDVAPQTKGSLTSNGKISGPRFSPTLQANFQLANFIYQDKKVQAATGKLHVNTDRKTTYSLDLEAKNFSQPGYTMKHIDIGIAGNVLKDPAHYISTFAVTIDNKRYISAYLSLPTTMTLSNYDKTEWYAKLDFNFPTLNTLQNYVPNTSDLRGNIAGALEFNGSINNPRVKGDVNLAAGNLTLPKLGITLRNINLHAMGNETRLLTYMGNFQAGEGSATVQGTTDFATEDFATELTLKGQNLPAVNLAEYKITFSPDLKLHFRQEALHLAGNINIVKADITPKDFRSTVTLPTDVVFVGAKPSTASALLATMPTMQINVDFGKNVFIHYQDLETHLAGHITITKRTSSPVTATGELYTQGGTYRAYGQILEIVEGRLIYTGNFIDNPGLNIRAQRSLKAMNLGGVGNFLATEAVQAVGVRLLGTLEQPSLTLYSIPPGLSQNDTLSYLIFGVPQSQASSNQLQIILAAASQSKVGGSGGSKLASFTNNLQESLGLTELKVGSVQAYNRGTGNYDATTSIMVGKQLSPRLSLHYSQGLFNPVSVLNLRYMLNKHWSVQSETSTIDNGADLMYSIESN